MRFCNEAAKWAPGLDHCLECHKLFVIWAICFTKCCQPARFFLDFKICTFSIQKVVTYWNVSYHSKPLKYYYVWMDSQQKKHRIASHQELLNCHFFLSSSRCRGFIGYVVLIWGIKTGESIMSWSVVSWKIYNWCITSWSIKYTVKSLI